MQICVYWCPLKMPLAVVHTCVCQSIHGPALAPAQEVDILAPVGACGPRVVLPKQGQPAPWLPSGGVREGKGRMVLTPGRSGSGEVGVRTATGVTRSTKHGREEAG